MTSSRRSRFVPHSFLSRHFTNDLLLGSPSTDIQPRATAPAVERVPVAAGRDAADAADTPRAEARATSAPPHPRAALVGPPP